MSKKLIAAAIADSVLGDPAWLYHPIRLIGKLIHKNEEILRKRFPKDPEGERKAGILLVPMVTLPSMLVPAAAIKLAAMLHPALGTGLEVFWMEQILAGRCMKDEALKVYDALMADDLPEARLRLSYLVGRDTANLTREEVIKATVETVAENTTDGVTAPMFYMLLGGAPAGFFYKAVNTMDSMVGYKNDKYRYFGTAAAKTDDVMNFIPSRMTGLLMAGAAGLCGMDGKRALKCFLRDRNAHLSPNSAQTESACAGALGIQLGGTHDYFGKPVVKPTLGDDVRPPEPEDIKKANLLLTVSSLMFFGLITIGRHELREWFASRK